MAARSSTPRRPAALIVVALLLLIAVGSLAFVAYRRGPRGEVTPDKAYAMITRLAGRLGFGPRPTQTVYEYAGALGEMLPQSRPEIQTVAQAKVEFAYGRQMLERGPHDRAARGASPAAGRAASVDAPPDAERAQALDG